MAKKNEPFMILETEEDFNKIFKSGEKTGYKLGFENGLVTALSYIVGPTYEIFSNYEFKDEDKEDEHQENDDGLLRFKHGRISYGKDLMSDAIASYRKRELENWRKQREMVDSEVRYKVEQELKKSSEDPKT